MFIFKINKPEVKNFMNILFKENIFDIWEVRGLDIFTFTKFQINGALENSLSKNQENLQKYSTWLELKPYALYIIKNGQRPKSIKIVFSLPEKQVNLLHENAATFFLNMNFENDEIVFTAANSEKNFLMDKSINNVWRDYIKKIFGDNKIPINEVN